MKKECERLLNSGAVDCEEYEANLALPKTILSVALQNIGREYEPCEWNDGHKEVKNLKHF